MIKVHINGKPYNVVENITVMQAAVTAGYKIPSLCYHPSFRFSADAGYA